MSFTAKTFSKEFLDKQRSLCDAWADAYAQKILSNCSHSELIRLFKWLNNTQNDCPPHCEATLQNYFASVEIPAWADRKRLQKAAVFFTKHENIILYLLGVLSLPYCYAARNGVQVLFLSQRLQNDTFERLKETALFVLGVNDFKVAHELDWKNTILKIRLLHALMRVRLRQNHRWQKQWGEPINQEDMAGTNLSFSYIVLRGMRKLGIAYTPTEAENFLHLWNVVGALLGIAEYLLPNTLQEAYWLDKQISEKEFAPSKEGQALCKALIEVFRQQSPTPLLADLAVAQMRFLLGKQVADILNIPPKFFSKAVPLFTISENIAHWLFPQNHFKKTILKYH